MNDKSLNETKYSEELDEISHTSTLTIKSFSITDVDIPYECVYGFKNDREILRLKEDAYEFHPKEKLPVKPIVDKDKIHLNVTFQLVYPAPVCSAKIGVCTATNNSLLIVSNISSDLNVSTTKHNLLYMSTITLNYTTSSTECTDSLIVICIVGKTALTVTNFVPCTSEGNPL
ncbi:unnamed protein product [Mytilus edulis]|uniref:Uncharacterized protein n=1 Tax=Mytilus edulis TaxID=6550 RepID=A0A8S3VBZ5_MYTED|nr:unnamed protein product [Mytilus edulis]